MPEITIWADTRAMGRCRSCGHDIEWAENLNGRRMPFDPPIRPVWSQTDLFNGRTVETIDLAQTPTHFVSCPDADLWRKKRP